jgi:dTDP-4-dehydrorhamnose reductase
VSGLLDREADVRLVVNAAAYTAVDRAEEDPEPAFSVNRDGPATLAAECAERRIPLIHLSTDYVFDGHASRPYRESDPAGPLSVYGASKLAGEEAIRARLETHIILRSSWVFGRHGSNFVKTMLGLGRQRDSISVVDDQRGCPTAAADLAVAIGRIAEQIDEPSFAHWGVFHYCGEPETTWFGFAEAIFEEATLLQACATPELLPISSVDFPSRARRPAYSVLDCRRIGKVFGIPQEPWRARLRGVISELGEADAAPDGLELS